MTHMNSTRAKVAISLVCGGLGMVMPHCDRGMPMMEPADMASPPPAPPATLTSITPSKGTVLGGTAVTINGSNFQPGATVTLDGKALGNPVIMSSQITGTTPARGSGPGEVDLMVQNPGQAALTLAKSFTYHYSNVSYGPASNLKSMNSPDGSAVADVNGDGKLDLVIGHFGAGVSVFLGKGDGTFDAAKNTTINGNPDHVSLRDLDGDGKLDLVVSLYSGGGISVYKGNGDGTFATVSKFASGTNPQINVLADMNSDGKSDIVVVNQGSSNLSVLLGNGDGTFQTAKNIATMNSYGVAVADVNGDGKLDAVVRGYGEGSVGLLFGNGDGTFQPMSKIAVKGNGTGVVIADLNRDGKPDIGASGSMGGSSYISVLIGNGDGTFQASADYNATGIAVAEDLVAFDADGDGLLDLATRDYNPDKGVLLLNKGNGTYQDQQPITLTSAGGGWSLCVGDFNGDKKPDLALPNNSNDTTSVFLNTST